MLAMPTPPPSHPIDAAPPPNPNPAAPTRSASAAPAPAGSDNESVRVVIQGRPLLPFEVAHNARNVLYLSESPPRVSIERPSGPRHTFSAFDAVFVPRADAPPDALYDCHVLPLLESLFAGLNATVFAYGQTSAGKSYTMRHVTARVAADLFRRKRAAELQAAATVSVRVGFVEIYRENIRDLVDGADAVAAPVRVQVRERVTKTGRTVFLDGARERIVNSEEELKRIINEAALMRRTAATGMNASSSRSHSIITISVLQESIDAGAAGGGCLAAKLHLVDLAGSERAKRTAAGGERFAEGVEINKGLFALAKVISTLADNASKPPAARVHVPYRDSKLTRLLQDSLGGNARTLLVACVSPADSSREETIGTLRYAERARCIRNKPKVNTDANAVEISDLRAALSRARAQIAELLADNERLRNRIGSRRRSSTGSTSAVTVSPQRHSSTTTENIDTSNNIHPSDHSHAYPPSSMTASTSATHAAPTNAHITSNIVMKQAFSSSTLTAETAHAASSADAILTRPPTRRPRRAAAATNTRLGGAADTSATRDIDVSGPPGESEDPDAEAVESTRALARSATAPLDSRKNLGKPRRAADAARLKQPNPRRRARQQVFDTSRPVNTRPDVGAPRRARPRGNVNVQPDETDAKPVRSKSAYALSTDRSIANTARRTAPNGGAARSPTGVATVTINKTSGISLAAHAKLQRSPDKNAFVSRATARENLRPGKSPEKDIDHDDDSDNDDHGGLDVEMLGKSVKSALTERRLEQMKRSFTERLMQAENDKRALDEERSRLARELVALRGRQQREIEELKSSHQSRLVSFRSKLADMKKLEAESTRLSKLRDGSDAVKKKLLGRVAAAERAREGLMIQLSDAVARSEGVQRALSRENRELTKSERSLRAELQRSESSNSRLEAAVNRLRMENEAIKGRLMRQTGRTVGGGVGSGNTGGLSEMRRANSAIAPGSSGGRQTSTC